MSGDNGDAFASFGAKSDNQLVYVLDCATDAQWRSETMHWNRTQPLYQQLLISFSHVCKDESIFGTVHSLSNKKKKNGFIIVL